MIKLNHVGKNMATRTPKIKQNTAITATIPEKNKNKNLISLQNMLQ